MEWQGPRASHGGVPCGIRNDLITEGHSANLIGAGTSGLTTMGISAA